MELENERSNAIKLMKNLKEGLQPNILEIIWYWHHRLTKYKRKHVYSYGEDDPPFKYETFRYYRSGLCTKYTEFSNGITVYDRKEGLILLSRTRNVHLKLLGINVFYEEDGRDNEKSFYSEIMDKDLPEDLFSVYTQTMKNYGKTYHHDLNLIQNLYDKIELYSRNDIVGSSARYVKNLSALVSIINPVTGKITKEKLK
jgi:hypothetical protein